MEGSTGLLWATLFVAFAIRGLADEVGCHMYRVTAKAIVDDCLPGSDAPKIKVNSSKHEPRTLQGTYSPHLVLSSTPDMARK